MVATFCKRTVAVDYKNNTSVSRTTVTSVKAEFDSLYKLIKQKR